MGRKLNISQPAVIQTELRPLDESFWIDANGGFEQWYYQNTNVFAPDRQITPLILSPHLSAIDRDTNTAYTPTFQLDSWEVKEYIDGAWVTTVITNQSQNESYVVQGLNLIVKKNNYDATHAINITCKATYQDPRDVGVLCRVQDSVMLVTSIDATQSFPTIDIVNPATRTYNPLKDESHVFEFEGKADWDGVEAQGGTAITECKVDPLGTEQILPTNDEMVINAAPTLNIKYGDVAKANQKFVYRQTANGEVPEIVGGVSAIDDIKGNTVVWNQIYNNLGFSTSTESGITYTIINRYTWNISGTATGRNTKSIFGAGSLNIGHKYYISIGQTIDGLQFGNNANESDYGVKSWVFIAENDNIQLRHSADAVITNKTINPILFDLTLMFGAGNEPSTVAELETWLANNVGLKDYYEYCSGKLVNFGGYGVKWNQQVNSLFLNSGTYSGLTVVKNDDLSYTISGTTTSIFDKQLVDNLNIVGGHKYMVNVGIPNVSINFGQATLSETNGNGRAINIPTNNSTMLLITVFEGVSINARIYPQVIDLTEMFGAGNEPDLEWCDKYFSKDYYPYCPSVEKNILDVMTTKESGFNIWDEEWESGEYDFSDGSKIDNSNCIRSKGFIPISPNMTCYCKNGSVSSLTGTIALFYDSNKTFLTGIGSGGVNYIAVGNAAFTTPNNAKYMVFHTAPFTEYNHDICINVSDPARNGEYEPYHAQYKSPEMGIKTTGFNAWDEEWKPDTESIGSKNFIPVIGGATYFFKIPVGWLTIYEYDANKVYNGSSHSVTNGAHTLSTNCAFIKFSTSSAYGATYNHDICINISDPSHNGTYEPYWESKSDMSWITKIGIENFNVWDEEWEVGDLDFEGIPSVNSLAIRSKNFCPCLPDTDYYLYCGSHAQEDDDRYVVNLFFYDTSKQVITSVYAAGLIAKSPQNAAYFKICTQSNPAAMYGNIYNHDICINLSNPHFNGRYYQHGETAPYFPNGLCNAGSVFDEVKVENGKIKGVVRLGSVDFGSLVWNLEAGQPSTFCSRIEDRKTGYMNNAICSKYPFSSGNEADFPYDKSFNFLNYHNVDDIYIRDSAYSDAAAFKTAMQGVMLYYELATPYEFEIDYQTKGQFMWYGVNSSGSEVPIDKLPIYSQATQPSGYGQGTSRININALYGENIPVILRVKRYPWSPTVLPPKVTKSVAWSVPPIDVITTCDKGSAVRSTNSSENFIFGTIVNQQGEIISDEKKAENMVFDWYMVKYGTSGAVKTSQGSGLTKSIPASTLKNTTPSGGVTPSTNVYCEAFLLGAYHLVDGQYVRTKD